MRWFAPKLGNHRKIVRFLIFGRNINGQWRLWEWATILRAYVDGGGPDGTGAYWEDKAWAN